MGGGEGLDPCLHGPDGLVFDEVHQLQGERSRDEVDVGVVEAGQKKTAARVHHARLGPRDASAFGGRAHEGEAPSAHREGFRPGPGGIGRPDAGVLDHQLGGAAGGGPGRRGRSPRHDQGEEKPGDPGGRAWGTSGVHGGRSPPRHLMPSSVTL